jgi:hypothetical protein
MSDIYVNTEGKDVLHRAIMDVVQALELTIGGNPEINRGAIAFETYKDYTRIDLSDLNYRLDSGSKEVSLKEFILKAASSAKDVEIKPSEIKVPLNSEYDAKVRKDTVTVGCQTFPYSKIEEILEAHKSLQ